MASTNASTAERRAKPHSRVAGGRRWREKPDRADAVDQILLSVSRDVYALRVLHEWTQEELAAAAGVHPDTVLNIEKMRDDVRLSTIASLADAAGFEVQVRFRRKRPATRFQSRRIGAPPQPVKA